MFQIIPFRPDTFEGKKPTFGIKPSGIAGQRTVDSDDAMARHEYGQSIRPDGSGDGTDSGWPADSPGQFHVWHSLSERNPPQFIPDRPLELSPDKKKRHIEAPSPAVEILVELPCRGIGHRRLSRLELRIKETFQAPAHSISAH